MSHLRNRHGSLLMFMVLGLVIAVAGPASAHFLGTSSVDSGEIRYDDYTQWDDARIHGINVWNALGDVDMLPDSAWTYTDLDIDDYSESDNLCGFFSPETGADTVNLNNMYFTSYTVGQRRSCVAQ